LCRKNTLWCLSRQEILFSTAKKVFKKVSADMKIAKINFIPLKEKKASLAGEKKFSFLCLMSRLKKRGRLKSI
jgi:hypothetical protein